MLSLSIYAHCRAIDQAIGKDSFKVVLLLRLSPLLPLSLSNYLYGLTSVDFWPYVAASFLGMLPGTWAYVSAGHVGSTVMREGNGVMQGLGGVPWWQVGLGVAATAGVLVYLSNMASSALEDIDGLKDTSKQKDSSLH